MFLSLLALNHEPRKLLVQSLQTIETARRAARGEIGRLDIGCIGALSDDLIPRLLRQFRSRFPDVAVRLKQMRPAVQAQALLADEIQLGFIGMPIPEMRRQLEFEVFRSDPMCVALTTGHPLHRRRIVRMEDLAGERFIFLTRPGTPTYYDWLIRLCLQAGFHPNITQEVESGQTAVELVAAGLGVALFPVTAQLQLHGEMGFHPLAGKLPRYEHAVAWNREDDPPALSAFLELLRSNEKEQRPS